MGVYTSAVYNSRHWFWIRSSTHIFEGPHSGVYNLRVSIWSHYFRIWSSIHLFGDLHSKCLGLHTEPPLWDLVKHSPVWGLHSEGLHCGVYTVRCRFWTDFGPILNPIWETKMGPNPVQNRFWSDWKSDFTTDTFPKPIRERFLVDFEAVGNTFLIEVQSSSLQSYRHTRHKRTGQKC